MKPLCLDILCHESDVPQRLKGAMMGHIAKRWEAQGHQVRALYGCETDDIGDVVIVHVNLSVVPDAYLKFASRYPHSINLGMSDIRKRVVSRHLLEEGDDYDGPVLVKTDLNAAGQPERRNGLLPSRRRAPFQSIRKRIGMEDPASIYKAKDYRVYPNLGSVPKAVFMNPDLVVEKYQPEPQGGEYYQRRYYFLGDAEYHEIHVTENAIHAGDANRHCTDYWQVPEIPEALRAYRRELKADFGKIDYVLKDGEVVIFDLNRTPGAGPANACPIEVEWFNGIADRLETGLPSLCGGASLATL